MGLVTLCDLNGRKLAASMFSGNTHHTDQGKHKMRETSELLPSTVRHIPDRATVMPRFGDPRPFNSPVHCIFNPTFRAVRIGDIGTTNKARRSWNSLAWNNARTPCVPRPTPGQPGMDVRTHCQRELFEFNSKRYLN